MKIYRKIMIFMLLPIITTILLFTNSSDKETADSEPSTVGYKYTVCEYNGKVAVFVYGEKQPETVLDCRIESLPESDAENVRKGIHVINDSELQYLIEAFD